MKRTVFVDLRDVKYHLELGKARMDYYNLSKEQEPDKKRIRHYECLIHKLQGQLRICPSMFSIFKLLTLTIVSEYKGIICKNVTETICRSCCPEKLDVKIICELCSQDVLYSSIIYIR